MKLYDYFRSSASYRVRIALNLKGIDWERAPVHLLKDGGQHLLPAYRAINPQALVPALRDDERVLTQSLAIIEYLDETHPKPPLLPGDPLGRARVRALALLVACDIHPLANLRVRNYLKQKLGLSDDQRQQWDQHWLGEGLAAFERLVAGHPETGTYCHGGHPTIADICLVPQLFNARRVGCDLALYPTILRIEAACVKLAAFERAHPMVQPDEV